MATAVAKSSFDPEGSADIRNCLQLVFGRQALSHHEIQFYRQASTAERIRRMVENMEFRAEIEAPITLIGFASASRFVGEPSQRFIDWLKEGAIPLEESSYRQVEKAGSWREILVTVWSDPNFLALLRGSTMSESRIRLFLDGLRRIPPESAQPLSQRFFSNLRTFDDNLSLITVEFSSAAIKQPDFSPMPYDIKEMIRIKPHQENFVAKKNDPQLIFPSIEPAFYCFRMRILYERAISDDKCEYAQMFFDFGRNYTEEHSVKFPISGGVVTVGAFMDVHRPVRSIRLDPTVGPANFRLECFSLNVIH